MFTGRVEWWRKTALWKSWEKCKHTSQTQKPVVSINTTVCSKFKTGNSCYDREFVSLLKLPARISHRCARGGVSLSRNLYSPCSFRMKESILQCEHKQHGGTEVCLEWPWQWQESRIHLSVKGNLQPGLVKRAHNPSQSGMSRRGVTESKAAWAVQWEPVSKWGLERALNMFGGRTLGRDVSLSPVPNREVMRCWGGEEGGRGRGKSWRECSVVIVLLLWFKMTAYIYKYHETWNKAITLTWGNLLHVNHKECL